MLLKESSLSWGILSIECENDYILCGMDHLLLLKKVLKSNFRFFINIYYLQHLGERMNSFVMNPPRYDSEEEYYYCER